MATFFGGGGANADDIIAEITDSAPETLNTLNELAAALNDDANFASTIATSLSSKANSTNPEFTIASVAPLVDLSGKTLATWIFDGDMSASWSSTYSVLWIIGSNYGFSNIAYWNNPSNASQIQNYVNQNLNMKYYPVDPTTTPSFGSSISVQNGVVVFTPITGSSVAISSSELAYLDGVTSAIQTQINGKANSSHTHAISDVTSLQTALDSKAATGHTHAISDVTGLQTAIDNKANSSHTHNMGQIVTTVSDKASAYTIIAADENTFIRSTSATAVNMTINNVLNIGESVQFIQFGAGQITFVAGSGVNLRSIDNKLKTNKQYSVAAVTCVASGEYLVTGDLVA